MGHRKLKCLLLALAVGLLLMDGTAGSSSAQSGTTQVSVLGVPPLLPSPIVEDLFADYDQGSYLFNIVYSSASSRPTTFRLKVSLTHDGVSVAEIQSLPIDLSPGVYSFTRFSEGPGFVFDETAGDLFDLLTEGLDSGFKETHTLPEGLYVLSAELVAENPAAAIVSVPGGVSFSVRFAQPPVLFTPSDVATVNQPYPVFSWTPVTVADVGMVEYDFLLVEMRENQSPLEAIEGNRAHLELTLEGQTTLQYGFQFLSLENGTSYAWQVRARDPFANTPITENGYSEIRSFVFNPSARPESLRQLTEIVLEPGFAVLKNFSNLDSRSNPASFVLSGNGELEFLGESPFRVPVRFENLEIQNVNLDQPVLMAGAVRSGRGPITLGRTPVPPIVQIEQVNWTFGRGFELGGSLVLPDGRTLDAVGQVRLSQAGLAGSMSASDVQIAESSDELVDFRVDEVSVSLPGGQLSGSGSATLFGESICTVKNLRFVEDTIQVPVSCTPDTKISLAGNDGEMSLDVERVDGSVSLSDAGVEYNLTARTNIELDTYTSASDSQEECGLRGFLSLNSEDGLSADRWYSSCTNPTPELDLGLFHARLMRLDVDEFAYEESEWDVSLITDIELSSPYLDNYTLPVIADVRINRSGIEIPETNFDEADLRDIIPMDALSLVFKKLDFPASRFVWFDWDKIGPGPWDFSYEAAIRFPDDNTQPECLRGGEMDVVGFYVEEAGLGGGVQADGIGECRIPLGASGTSIVTDKLEAKFGTFLNFDPDVYEQFKIMLELTGEGRIEYGEPFVCEEAADDVGEFSFSPSARAINLEISNFVPSCALSVGPLTAQVLTSDLVLEGFQKQQRASLTGSGRIQLDENNTADGTFGLNLVTGEFTQLDFALESAFSFAIPSDKPVFNFTVDRARLNTEGLLVDGEQRLQVGPTTSGVQFDAALLDLGDGKVRDGEIRFTESVGLAAGVDEDSGSLNFVAAPLGGNPPFDPGFVADLEATAVLDSAGFHFTGDVDGRLLFDGNNYQSDLRAEFSDNFFLDTHPPGIGRGQIDFYWKDTRVAYADPTGLHPAAADLLTEILPDVLPLPTVSVAYLRLKTEDTDLVSFTELGGGLIAINSIGDGPVLVIPALDPLSPPEFANVSLNDVVVRASGDGFAYESGSVGVSASMQGPEDWPISIEAIIFEDRAASGPGLYVDGSLELFGQDLGANAAISLHVSAVGASGIVELTNLDARLPLVGSSEVVSLNVNSVTGTVDVGQTSHTRLDLDTRIEIVSGDQVATGADLQLRWDGSSLVVTGFDLDGVGGGTVDVGPVSLRFDGIESVGGLSFSDVGGWLFDIALDAQLVVRLDGDRQLVIPLRNLAATQSGLIVPAQEINNGTVPGLDLPALSLAGISIKPIGLQTDTPVVLDWYSTDLSNVLATGFTPSFDFELRVAALAASGLIPSDGLTVFDATIVDGLIDATIEPFVPGVAVELPVVPTMPEGPLVSVSEIGGSLSASAQRSQLISIDLMATLDRLGVLDDEVACSPSAPFRMQMIDGLYFQGSIQTYQSCGEFPIGPASLTFGPSAVSFEFTPDSEQVLLNGSATVSLPGPSQNSSVSASGTIEVDVLAGTVTDGSISLDQPFSFGVPLDAEDPLLVFGASSALLDPNGFAVSGAGVLDAEGANAAVQFADLLFGFPELAITSGSASIESTVDLQVDLSPLEWSFVSPNEPQPSDNYLRVALSGGAVLSSAGLGFSGAATADLSFADTPFASLTTEFGNGFALNVGPFAVNQGHAHFFTADDPDEPLAILDENGFSIGGGILALLPAQIGLPTVDVAYLVTRDAQGNPLIDAVQSGDGWNLETSAPVSLVLAGLEDSQGNTPTIDVDFQLSADAAYNVLGGTVALASPLDLDPYLGIPVTLDALSLVANSPLSLIADLSIDLPAALGDHDLSVSVGITPTGFSDIQVELGNYSTVYSDSSTPISDHTFSTGQANSLRTLSLALQGIRIGLGDAPTIAIAAVASSSLLGDPNNPALFFAGEFASDSWSFDVDPIGIAEVIPLGVASLRPLGQDPFGVTLDNSRFEVSIDGELSFEELLGEPFEIGIQDFVVGVRNVDTNPSIVFEVPSLTLADQSFELFEGAVELELDAPTLGMSNNVIAVSSNNGAISFANMDVDFGELSFDTEGAFTVSDISVGDVEILNGLASLTSVGLGMVDGTLRLDASLNVTLPEPVDLAADATLSIFRDDQGTVQFEADLPAFELDGEYALGDFGTFKLTNALVDIDPFDPYSSGIFMNGVVEVDDEPVVWFGSDANFPNESGISYTDLSGLQYNVSGNVSFDLETSFFSIAVAGDAATSSSNAFQLELGGSATVMIEGVGGSVGYEGFTVGAEGVTDVGRLVAPAEFTLLDIMTLSVGKFEYTSSENGVAIEIADGFGQGIGDVQNRAGQEAPSRQVTVTEYLCFGRCGSGGSDVSLSIGGNSSSDNGVFSGGVDEVLFYKTQNGSTYLHVDNFNMQVSDVFTMSASLQYENSADGLTLRAVGGGVFEIGNTQAQAALAGSFSTVNDELSFGLFVAVASDVGIPIVPGVIDLTGAGGGFFYNPKQTDLNLVTGPNGALAAFGYTPVKPVPAAGDVDFAAMLFAKAGIGGGAGNYVVNGNAFLQVTNRSIVIDAKGTVLKFDGNGFAGAKLSAGFSVAASRAPFAIDGNVVVDVDIPIYASGGLGLNLFLLERNDELVWGIIGDGELRLINDLFTATGSFAAADIGFLLEAGISFDFEIPIISLNASAEGSIWLMTDEQFPMPFGAYATVSASVCVDLLLDEACASADLRAAIVKRRPSGFELFGAIGVEIPIAGTVRAWAAASQDGVRFGFGEGGQGDLIAEAKAQAEQFKEYVASLADEIDAARGEMDNQSVALEDLVVSAADAEAAGARFHAMNEGPRTARAMEIINNEPSSAMALSGLSFVRDSLLLGDSPGTRPLQGDSRFDAVFEAQGRANALEAHAVEVADLVAPRLRQAQLEAIEFREDAAQVLDEFYNSLATSPVTSFDQGHSGDNAQAPIIVIDQAAASSIANQSTSLAETVASSADQTLDAIDTISDNLSRIRSLMAMQVTGFLTYNPITREITSSFSSEPSVNDMMLAFSTAETAFDEYYARYGDWYWTSRAWALRMQNKLQTLSGQIRSNLGSAYNAQATKADRIATSAERVRILAELSDSPNAQSAYQAHATELSNFDDSTLRESYITNGTRLWYDFHNGGMTSLSSVLASSALDILGEQRNRVAPLIAAHTNATNTMEQVYQLRADITAMQYVLIDNLLSQNTDGAFLTDSVETHLTSLKEYVGKSLQVPSISNISIQSSRTRYVSESSIGLSVQHPLNVSEVSVQIERDGGTDVDSDLSSYRSIGKGGDMPFFAGRSGYSRDNSNEAFHEEKRYSIGVRARGPAGNTAIRRAQFTVAVGPQGVSTADSNEEDVLVDDPTPPEAPRLFLGERYGSSTVSLLVPDPPNGFKQISAERYWSTDATKISVFTSARDPESDISTFEYAIGTSLGGEDAISWTQLQGTRFVADGIDGLPAVFVDGSSRVFALQPGQPYYVSVRATNGEGMVSPATSDGPVILDQTAPTDPKPSFTALTFPIPLYFPPPVHQPVNYVPDYNHPGLTVSSYIVEQIEAVVPPNATAIWQESIDPESGIDAYEYAVHRDNAEPEYNPSITVDELNKAFQAFGPAEVGPGFVARFNGLPKSYIEPVVVDVRARNNAGMTSQTLTVQALATDLTSPRGLDMRARVRVDAIDLFLTNAVYDFESDVAGIEYSIGSTAGATDIRGWPTDPDFSWSNVQSAFHQGTAAPSFTIARASLPEGTFYINVRARNTVGGRGGIVVAGPITLDTSPPVVSSLVLSKSGGNLQIAVTGMQDPESGLASIQYKVDDRFDIFKTTGWRTFRYVYGNPTSAIDYTRIVDVSDVVGVSNAKVTIRLTNGTGLQSNTTATMPIVFPF